MKQKEGLFAEVIEIESERGKMRTQVIKWKKKGYQDETGTVDLDEKERKKEKAIMVTKHEK